MAREYTIILGIILIGITFTIFLGGLNPNTDKITTAPIPEPVIEVEEKEYEKYEMGNYR